MAFQLKADQSIPKAIRRIVREQIDKSLEGLAGGTGSDPEEAIHDARKRFKKVRAVLRLARGSLPRRVYQRENVRFRDAGRPLSEVRDAAVLVQALDRLADRPAVADLLPAIAGVRAALLERKDSISRRVLQEQDARAGVVASLREARDRLKDWHLDANGWLALRGGTRWIYQRGHRAYRAASGRPTDEALHECRKRVKDLWYAAAILRPVRPAFLDDLRAQAHRLADALGDDHDLAVLRAHLAGPARGMGEPAAVARILAQIDARRTELLQDALRLGAAVYRDRPKVFLRRIGAYWLAWQAEIAAASFDTDDRRPQDDPS